MHAPIHIVDAPKIDENNDSEVIELIDKYITCALLDEEKYPEVNKLVKKVETHHHTITCGKKNGVTCRFNAPWTPSMETRIVRCEENKDEMKVKSSKILIEKVLCFLVKIDDLSYVTQSEILEKCGVTGEQYNSGLICLEKKVSVLYKRKPCKVNIGTYNTVILKLWKASTIYKLSQVCMQCLLNIIFM